LAPKMDCADKYEGPIRALPGLCAWGYRARTVRNALSNSRHVGEPKRETGAQRSNMKAYATVAQIRCICDGERRCWAGRCGGNARNRVYRLTTDMRSTQGQAPFGYSAQTIMTHSNKVKNFSNTHRIRLSSRGEMPIGVSQYVFTNLHSN
jgi:hypothetical protein